MPGSGCQRGPLCKYIVELAEDKISAIKRRVGPEIFSTAGKHRPCMEILKKCQRVTPVGKRYGIEKESSTFAG
ncbi:Dna Topoisomerase 3-Beta-1 [Manis pentadactyla]|nr:Dna Topoisomerase 3-Beta-1 [Manis pentadactyla]